MDAIGEGIEVSERKEEKYNVVCVFLVFVYLFFCLF